MKIKEYVSNMYNEYKRIIIISKKPTLEEYLDLVRISAIGIGLIGLIGFLVEVVSGVISRV
ncbi:Uncharacterised protein [Candidatus Tiddalikarchaeum anstoanum]|nr:Uncharacterised protein [Candidatus Tiddalikarchaeum anstoanum]